MARPVTIILPAAILFVAPRVIHTRETRWPPFASGDSFRQVALVTVAHLQEVERDVVDWSEQRAADLRALLYVTIALMVVALTAQRSFFPHPHWTFRIFRSSFWHLIHQQDLYAPYAGQDFFKYSPTAALLFAPFAAPPFPLGLLLWNACNAIALIFALRCLVGRRNLALAMLLVIPELYNAMQASQSNALVAALIVFAFVALEGDRQLRGCLAIAVGVAIKIFPIAALSFAIFHPRRLRAAFTFTICAAVLAALPLTVTSPSMLLAQYGWWHRIEMTDALARGDSVMFVLHQLFRVSGPNWPVQLAGVAFLLLPLIRRDRWDDARFRRAFLASLLVFVVIFNHQAERQSFVIAAVGVAIWFVGAPRGYLRLGLVLLSLAGLGAAGYLPVWLAIQCELHGSPLPFVRQSPHASRAGDAVQSSSLSVT